MREDWRTGKFQMTLVASRPNDEVTTVVLPHLSQWQVNKVIAVWNDEIAKSSSDLDRIQINVLSEWTSLECTRPETPQEQLEKFWETQPDSRD